MNAVGDTFNLVEPVPRREHHDIRRRIRHRRGRVADGDPPDVDLGLGPRREAATSSTGGQDAWLRAARPRSARRSGDPLRRHAPAASARWRSASRPPHSSWSVSASRSRSAGLRALTEERHRQAVTDELTGLGNRRRLTGILDEYFADYADPQTPTRDLAFLFVDLDHFKEINDSFGHSAGDELLKQLGPRLTGSLRASDVLVRIGGDELGAVLIDTDPAYAMAVAQRLTALIEQPFVLNAVSVHISASIGIAMAPTDATDSVGLMRCADVAMYRAKLGAAIVRDLPAGHRRRRQPARARRRAARRRRERAAGAPLPAAGGSAERRDGRRRGPRALAAPAPRHDPAARVPSARRGGRPDGTAHPARARAGARAMRGVACRRSAPRGLGERLVVQPARPGLHRPRARGTAPLPRARLGAGPRDHRDDDHSRLRRVQAGHRGAPRARRRRFDRRLRIRIHLARLSRAALPSPSSSSIGPSSAD